MITMSTSLRAKVLRQFLSFCFLLFFAFSASSQQIADTLYKPDIAHPEYPAGKGPVVCIDEGHFNFHTREGRYRPFALLLERDGYNVNSCTGSFTKSSLEPNRILVISNALNEINAENWYLPTPSAFTGDEINAVRDWVKKGGSLFLIADHMPLAGAAAEMAAAFGFTFMNGFTADTSRQGTDVFSLADGTLHECTITKGRNAMEAVSEVATFTGQSFDIPAEAQAILTFTNHYVTFMPDTAWVFTDTTPRMPAAGQAQGAYRTFGKGRIVVFGEAAMFSAQISGPNQRKAGMNTPEAKQNFQLLLNIIHWLDHRYD